MNKLLGGNECERTHTLTTTTKGSKNSQKEANNQTSNQNSVLCPPKVPSLQIFWSWMKSSARHTLSNHQVQEKPETVNLTENVAKDTSKGSLFDCQENVPVTALTVV